MKIYNSLEEILSLFPDYTQTGREYKTACIFCSPGTFQGEDRSYWPSGKGGVGCRVCKREGRKAWHTYQQILDLLDPGSTLSEDLADAVPFDPARYYAEDPELFSEKKILELHENVNREYWYAFGWTDETIDRFKLGYGNIGKKWKNRHIIPMIPSRADGKEYHEYAAELRDKQLEKKLRNVKTDRLSRAYFWIANKGTSKRLWITEGPKDAITVSQLFPKDTVWAEFGSTNWFEDKAYHLIQNFNPAQLIVLGDNDEAGQAMNREVANLHQQLAYTIRWPNGIKDVSDLLLSLGSKTEEYILQNIIEISENSRGYIKDYRTVDPTYKPAEKPYLFSSLREVRTQMGQTLRDYVHNYKRIKSVAKKPVLQIFAARPGSGKSYEMAHVSQELGLQAIKEYNEKKQRLLQEIGDAEDKEIREALQHKYDTMSPAHVMYAGPFKDGWNDLISHEGIDQSLFYNYQPRDQENCKNLDLISVATNKGYNGRAFCESLCPFRAGCPWLQQDEERKQYPILYARHNNLVTSIVDEYKVFMIDEDMTHVVDGVVQIGLDDLRPSQAEWDYLLDENKIKLFEKFIEALRALTAHSENLSGYTVQARLDELSLGLYDRVMREIDVNFVEKYQPERVFEEDYGHLPKRCIPQLFSILQREYEYYNEGLFNWNTQVHKIGNKIFIYPIERIPIGPSKPIVIADGTAMPEQYALLFDRTIRTYRPTMHSDLAHTTVLHGSDFTKTTIKSQIGKALPDFELWKEERQEWATNIYGELVDFSGIEINEDVIYGSSLMVNAVTLVKHYANAHKSLLVVTYKAIEELIRYRTQDLKNISIAHYGALRGTNRYKDYEAVLLIGSYRIPYDSLWRTIQAWAALRDPRDYIGPEIITKPRPYHGTMQGNTYVTFNNPFADQFVHKVEEGEIIQCLERIRMHTSTSPKYCYLAMNRPAAHYIENVISMKGVVNKALDNRDKDVLQYIHQFYSVHFKLPSYEQVRKKFKLSNDAIKVLRERFSEEWMNQEIVL